MPINRRSQGSNNYALRNRSSGAKADGLMLVHVTSVGAAREILSEGQLSIRRCKVFGRDLVYFFVFRPAYKVPGSLEKREIIDYFPFVFVLDPSSIGPPHHVYPFDTGGAVIGAFDGGQPSPWVYLEDFALEENLCAAANHIEWAFESRASYFEGALKPTLEEGLNDFDSHGRSFLAIALLASHGHNQPDLRASSIEVAYSHNIPLCNNVKFAVLPRQFLESRQGGRNIDIIGALEKFGIIWETFDWRPNSTPDDFRQEINDKVQNWLTKGGLL